MRARCDRAARRDADPVGIVHRYEDAGRSRARRARRGVHRLRQRQGHPREARGPARAGRARARREAAEDAKRPSGPPRTGGARASSAARTSRRLLAGARAVQREHGSLGALFEAELARSRRGAGTRAGGRRGRTPCAWRSSALVRRHPRGGRPPPRRAAAGARRTFCPTRAARAAASACCSFSAGWSGPADGIDLGMWNVAARAPARPGRRPHPQARPEPRLHPPAEPLVEDHRGDHAAPSRASTQRTPSPTTSPSATWACSSAARRAATPRLCEGCGVKPVCVHWSARGRVSCAAETSESEADWRRIAYAAGKLALRGALLADARPQVPRIRARRRPYRRMVRAHRRGHRVLPGPLRDRRRALLRLLDHRRRAHHGADRRPPQPRPHARRLRRRRRATGRGARAAAPHARRLPAAPRRRAPRRRRQAGAGARARDRRRGHPALHRRSLPAARAALRLLAAQAGPRAARGSPELVVLHDGVEETHELDAFRFRIRALVREELERAASRVARAPSTSRRSPRPRPPRSAAEWTKVVQLLGSWPAPLAIFLRTPEGQMLTPDARGLIAKGLGLLGSACVHLGEIEQAEEVFRIGIQYAQEGVAAAELFRRLGEALLQSDRAGEAIGPLRRAAGLRRLARRGDAAARPGVPASARSSSPPTPACATRSRRACGEREIAEELRADRGRPRGRADGVESQEAPGHVVDTARRRGLETPAGFHALARARATLRHETAHDCHLRPDVSPPGGRVRALLHLLGRRDLPRAHKKPNAREERALRVRQRVHRRARREARASSST